MFKAVTGNRNHIALSPQAEEHRHAYNAAFEELSLPWHWDAATFLRVQAHGEGGLRAYLETEQAHLLRAYEADFLVRAIETAKARCHASAGYREHPTFASQRAEFPRLVA